MPYFFVFLSIINAIYLGYHLYEHSSTQKATMNVLYMHDHVEKK